MKKDTKVKNKEVKNNIILSKKIYRLIILTVVIIVVALITTVIYTNFKYSRYIKFENDMNIYGFNNIYDNGSAKTNEKITKLEALKMTISSIYNYSDFNSFYFSEEQADDNAFLDIMIDRGIIETSEGFDKEIKYLDVLEYFVKAKKIYLDEQLKDYTGKIKGLSSYSLDKQAIVKDIVASEIVELQNESLPLNDVVVKGMLNEIVVNFVQKYNTITVNRDKININPEKLPANSNEYPYTLASVDKAVYEKENINVDDDYKNSTEIFSKVKEEYLYIEEIVNNYLGTILNVDYTNIDETAFKNSIDGLSLFNITDTNYDEYFSYVKENKIQISGTAKVQFPAVYFDGLVYRVRTKINLNITNANTNVNLLFMDIGQLEDVKYEGSAIDTIVDIPLSRYYNNLQFGIYVNSLFPSSNESRGVNNAEEELTGVWW